MIFFSAIEMSFTGKESGLNIKHIILRSFEWELVKLMKYQFFN